MRANAATRERLLVGRCTYELYRWQRAHGPTSAAAPGANVATETMATPFVLHDGPPYANGSLHMGHLLNKVLKDFINRFALLRGRTVEYQPGWDCHGLPIELKALQSLSPEAAAAADPTEIRRLARSCALEAIMMQRDDFLRWGIMADWEWKDEELGVEAAVQAAEKHSIYITMSPQYEAAQLEVFRDMVLSGLVHRGLKPVHWSPSSKTALAEAELEYNDDHVSDSVFVRFPLRTLGDDACKSGLSRTLSSFSKSGSSNEISRIVDVIIWTTTPCCSMGDPSPS